MNERINQLLCQAYDEAVPETWTTLSSVQLGRIYDKFAELIIRECIAIVEPSSYRRAYPENYRGGMDCLDTLDDRVEKIKEHFGVE